MQARLETRTSDTLSQNSQRPTILTIEMCKTPFAPQFVCGRAKPFSAIWQYRRARRDAPYMGTTSQRSTWSGPK